MAELLPENAGDLCSGRVSITITEVRPWFIPFRRRQVSWSWNHRFFIPAIFNPHATYARQITEFKTKADVIQVSAAVMIGLRAEPLARLHTSHQRRSDNT
jgi:hypothetical protein